MKRVLVVDDDDIVRDVLAQALVHFGHGVYKATTGKEAVEMLKKYPEIEIVILDLRMPEMTGDETCVLLKNINPGIEIIISTAYVDEKARKKLSDNGVKYILRKPYPLTHLQNVIASCQEISEK